MALYCVHSGAGPDPPVPCAPHLAGQHLAAVAQPRAGAGGGGGDAHQQLEDWPLCQHVSKVNLLIVLTYLFSISNDPKLSLKEFVKRDCRYYLSQLESKMLTKWIWGPRQNRESHKSILKPIEKVKYI